MLRRFDQARRSARHGAVAVETALILMTFLTMVLGMIDLGIGVFRWHTIAEAARIGARDAMVHGSLAGVPWTSANAASNIQNAKSPDLPIQALLNAAGIQTFQVAATYLDGGNAPGNRVQVTVSSTYQPVFTWLFSGAINLSATSTMAITH